MGSKTLILSQRQLDEVIGANSAYLDSAVQGDFREYPSNEVSPQIKLDREDSVPITSDDVANKLSQKNSAGLWNNRNYGSNGIQSLQCSKESKKKISESNSRLEGKFFKIGPSILNVLQKTYSASNSKEDSPGRITLKNILDNGGLTYTDATSIKSRMDKLDPKSIEYMDLGGKCLHRYINLTLSNATDIIDRDKEHMAELGFENVYQKKGGTKNSNGKAHTKKNQNIIIKQ